MTDEPNDIQASDEDEQINDEDLMEEITSLQEQGILEEPDEDDEFSDDIAGDEDEAMDEDDEFADGMDVTVESVIEAVLFASDEPLSAQRLVNIVDTGSVKQVRQCVENLNQKYDVFEVDWLNDLIIELKDVEYIYYTEDVMNENTDNKSVLSKIDALNALTADMQDTWVYE